MKFQIRIMVWLALAGAGGCASPPPADLFAKGVDATGIAEPIEFVTDAMPLDAAPPPSADGEAVILLPDALRLALKNDAAIQASIARVRIALADAKQARLLPNPVISVAVRFPSGGGEPIIDAGLMANLVALLTQPRQISAADNQLRAASSEALATVLDVLADVQEQYARVQALDAELAILGERCKLVAQLLHLAETRVKAGESPQLDALTLASERVALDVDVAQAALEQRDSRLTLARLLGQPSSAADWTLAKWSPPAMKPLGESAWIAAALEHRTEIQARRWELAALGDQWAIAQFAAIDGAEIGIDSERDGSWSVGPALSIPLPLLDWGQARREKVKAQQIEARHAMTETRRKVVEEVRRAIAALASSHAAMKTVESELIPLQEKRQQQAEASYKNGFADVTAVLLAEQDAQAARSKLVELQHKVSSANFRLERAAGGPGIVPSPATTGPTTQISNVLPSEEP